MISNTDDGRFLFGTFDVSGTVPVFKGAVVHGSGLTYDPDSKVPTGGTVERIDIQTRSADTVLETHATYDGLDLNVDALNADFNGADAPWYDPTQMFDAMPDGEDPTGVLVLQDTPDVADSQAMSDFMAQGGDLILKTGEVLTAQELGEIFADQSDETPPNVPAQDFEADLIALLTCPYDETPSSDYSDLDVDALEHDLLFGVL